MPHHQSFLRLLAWDAGAAGLLALTGLATGITINLARSQPFPWRYETKENRLDQALHLAAPPHEINNGATASAKTRAIDLEEFQRFATENRGIVLDARSGLFFRAGHVPGALNLSREGFEKDYAALRPSLDARKSQPIAVYCSGPDCQDSELVAKGLVKLGFADVLVYPDGWEQWTAAGLPQEPPAKTE